MAPYRLWVDPVTSTLPPVPTFTPTLSERRPSRSLIAEPPSGTRSARRAGGAAAPRRLAACAIPLAIFAALAGSPTALGQAASGDAVETESLSPYDGRFIAEVRVEGLDRVSPELARNQLRTRAGRPLSWATVQQDLRNLERLGEFRQISADLVLREDSSIEVVFLVVEAPLVLDIIVTGNRSVSDEELAFAVGEVALLVSGVPIDDFRIGQAAKAIERVYRTKGYPLAAVTVDESRLQSHGEVIFKVREGERLSVVDIRFRGNSAFSDKQLRSQVSSKTKGILERAPLDDRKIEADVTAIVDFYRDRGYLDIRASRTILPSPNGKEAVITFLVDEGKRYTIGQVTMLGNGGAEGAPDLGNGLTVLAPEQARALTPLNTGAVYSENEVDDAARELRDGLRQMGYVDATVRVSKLRRSDTPIVDIALSITEGSRWKAGLVEFAGNTLTKSKVIRREAEILPDHWLDGTAGAETERLLRNRGLFRPRQPGSPGPRVTIQPAEAALGQHRDVLVEVEETNTGRIGFGASVNSDAGLAGGISLTQRNFDIADTPDSLDEFLRGRAFRGAGQTFQLNLQPGTDVSNYSISLSEPALLETDYTGSGAIYFRERRFRDYDEERYGVRLALGRRFGTQWTGNIAMRAESIGLNKIDDDAPVDIFEVEDQNLLTGLGLNLTRTTVDNRFRPTRGARTELGIEQVGAIGGDFDFTKISAEHSVFLTIGEDYLNRKTILSLSTSAAYIPGGDAPIYERYNLGGRSLRGWSFRGIGPVGVRNDTGELGSDQVGGTFSFTAKAEVEQPLISDVFSVVGFIDSGTIQDEISLNDYRVSVGFGVRMFLPALGQAPLAFDFAFPLLDEDTDDTQLFSFSLDLPY